MNKSDKKRPELPDRYETFTTKNRLHNSIIAHLEGIYARTNDEGALHALRDVKTLKAIELGEFWEDEAIYRAMEEAEFWQNPGKWPDAVRDWMIHYRDKEMSS